MNESLPAYLEGRLSAGMGPDLHWFPEDVSSTRLAAVLAGMANTAGGVVLIGVSPRSGHVHGVRDPESVMDCVFQAALLLDPPLVLPVPRLIDAQGNHLVEVTIPAGLPHIYSQDGRYLGREGAQTNPLPARQLRRLLLERGVIQFESLVPPGVSLDDLDSGKVSEYVAMLNLPGSANESTEEILTRRGCLTKDRRPNYAALLLFGCQPQRWAPGATLLAAQFSGPSMSDRFVKLEAVGTLPDQLRQVEAFARQNIRHVVRMVGLTHQETSEYPLEAVRELLVNAVAHRDYNIQGDMIHFNLYSDRVEIHSPGGLPGPVNLGNLLEARFSRNAVIVQVLSDMGFVERLGYGLDRVVSALRDSGLRPPRFEEAGGSFRVTLFGEGPKPVEGAEVDLARYLGLGLNPRQEAALACLSQRKRITSRDFQELCPEVHPETLRRDLADLAARGILIKVGDKRATYYILK